MRKTSEKAKAVIFRVFEYGDEDWSNLHFEYVETKHFNNRWEANDWAVRQMSKLLPNGNYSYQIICKKPRVFGPEAF